MYIFHVLASENVVLSLALSDLKMSCYYHFIDVSKQVESVFLEHIGRVLLSRLFKFPDSLTTFTNSSALF